MASIKYVGPLEGVAVGDVVFVRGEAVDDVDASLVKELLKRDDFERPSVRKKAAPKKAAAAKVSAAPASDDTPDASAPVDPPQEG